MVHLQIETFGRTHILKDGEEVKWSAHSAKELLLYLLSYPKGRTRHQILDDLWHIDPDTHTNNRFRVTLHRLRTTLGDTDTVTEHAGRFHLAPDIWRASDVYHLYAILNEARSDQDPQHRTALLQQAVQLYQGDYLSDLEADWAARARDEYKSAYVQANLELSLLHCDQGACRHSVSTLVQALHTDPYVGEDYHQRLMTCLSVVEGPYSAIEYYRRFVNFLHDGLDDTPMLDTRALARRLKLGEHICQRDDRPSSTLPLARSCPLTPDGQCPGELHALMQLDATYQP